MATGHWLAAGVCLLRSLSSMFLVVEHVARPDDNPGHPLLRLRMHSRGLRAKRRGSRRRPVWAWLRKPRNSDRRASRRATRSGRAGCPPSLRLMGTDATRANVRWGRKHVGAGKRGTRRGRTLYVMERLIRKGPPPTIKASETAMVSSSVVDVVHD
jgi:hypothetical protein